MKILLNNHIGSCYYTCVIKFWNYMLFIYRLYTQNLFFESYNLSMISNFNMSNTTLYFHHHYIFHAYSCLGCIRLAFPCCSIHPVVFISKSKHAILHIIIEYLFLFVIVYYNIVSIKSLLLSHWENWPIKNYQLFSYKYIIYYNNRKNRIFKYYIHIGHRYNNNFIEHSILIFSGRAR